MLFNILAEQMDINYVMCLGLCGSKKSITSDGIECPFFFLHITIWHGRNIKTVATFLVLHYTSYP